MNQSTVGGEVVGEAREVGGPAEGAEGLGGGFLVQNETGYVEVGGGWQG